MTARTSLLVFAAVLLAIGASLLLVMARPDESAGRTLREGVRVETEIAGRSVEITPRPERPSKRRRRTSYFLRAVPLEGATTAPVIVETSAAFYEAHADGERAILILAPTGADRPVFADDTARLRKGAGAAWIGWLFVAAGAGFAVWGWRRGGATRR